MAALQYFDRGASEDKNSLSHSLEKKSLVYISPSHIIFCSKIKKNK